MAGHGDLPCQKLRVLAAIARLLESSLRVLRFLLILLLGCPRGVLLVELIWRLLDLQVLSVLLLPGVQPLKTFLIGLFFGVLGLG